MLWAPMLLPKLYLTLQKALGQCSHMQHWDWCAMICHLSAYCTACEPVPVSSPKRALTPCHNSSPSNLHQGTVCTRASKVGHFLEKFLKQVTHCALGMHRA